MKIEKLNFFLAVGAVLLLFGMSSCNKDGEANKLYQSFNQEKNDYLNDQEFYGTVAELRYLEKRNQDGDQLTSEGKWSAGVNEYLGGYKVAEVEEFGEWDLHGDSQVSGEEFREGLFEVVDKDRNRQQLSESEFNSWYNTEGQGGSRSGS